MPRILIAECKQEVSSFNPVPSRFEDFRVVRGAALLDHHRGGGEEVGGALSVFDADQRVQLVPACGASSNTSGGVLSAASFERLSRDFLGGLSDVGPVDAAFFSLHGAMQAENEDDPEGFLLREARRLLGEQIPFVVSLDLHGILTDRMLEHSDAVVAYHTYPHVDFFQTGVRAASLLLKILTRGVRPVTARVKIPALVRGDELITETGSIRECIQLAQQIEASDAGLSAGVMWGNPFTDVPELRTNSFVVMDGDESAARTQAIELANRFWRHHEKMQVPLTSLANAVRLAGEVRSGTLVMMDAADATSSVRRGTVTRSCVSCGSRTIAAECLLRSSIRRRYVRRLQPESARRFGQLSGERLIRRGFSRCRLRLRCDCCPTAYSEASRSAGRGTLARRLCCKRTT